MVDDTMNKEPVIVAPLRLEKIRISYQRIGEEEVELTTILEQETIDAIKDAMVSFNPDNNAIKRVSFENHLKQHHPEVKIDHSGILLRKLGCLLTLNGDISIKN